MECGFPNPLVLIRFGPTVPVNIGFDPNWRPVPGRNAPDSGILDVHALVDTGATESCIDNLLAAALSLPVVDRQPIAGISGKDLANIYVAQVYVPALNHTVYGRFAGVDLRKGGQVHSALLGRTFLQSFRMEYDGTTGAVTITYPTATPSN